MIYINNHSNVNISSFQARCTTQKTTASSVEKTSPAWRKVFDSLAAFFARLLSYSSSSKPRQIVNFTNQGIKNKVIHITPKVFCVDEVDNPLPTVKNEGKEPEEGTQIPFGWIIYPYIEIMLNSKTNEHLINCILPNLENIKVSDLDGDIVKNIIKSLAYRTAETEPKILEILKQLATSSNKPHILQILNELASLDALDNPLSKDEENTMPSSWIQPPTVKRGRSLTI